MTDVKEVQRLGKYFKNFSFVWKGGLGYLAYIAIVPPWLPAWLHKRRGVKIENYKTVYIAPNVLIDTSFPELIEIGDDVYITRGAKIIAHTSFTPKTQLLVGTEYTTGPVVIEAGAYIGVNAVVLPSVRIGSCSIVGAGAIVTKDVPAHAIVGGNPARIIGDVRQLKLGVG
jgi:acetyltransferase-like isoleucine patch superfamily enzyme